LSTPVAVLKFGGTSLGDVSGFERVVALLCSAEVNESSPPIAIVSAMSGVTDALMMSWRLSGQGDVSAAKHSLEPHFERHLDVAASLGATTAARMGVVVEQARHEITALLAPDIAGENASSSSQPAKLDAITAYGEMLSAQLLTLVLNECGAPASYVDSRRCIKTNGEHGNAWPLLQETAFHTRAELQGLLAAKRLPVLGGFIGATMDGATTTMGRGSSNHTATLVSAVLCARETQIWTDVNGVHTADPHLIKHARTISHLSFDEAEEMARLGAKVLHERMFEPVRASGIPIRIRNSQSPNEAGTLISARGQGPETPAPTIKAITHKNHLVKIDVQSTPALVANGFQRSIAAILDRYGVLMEIVGRSAEGLSLACDESAPLDAIVRELKTCGAVEVEGRRAIVGCVGEGLQARFNCETRMTEILKSFDSRLEWQKLSNLNLVSMVEVSLVGPLVSHLHRELFER